MKGWFYFLSRWRWFLLYRFRIFLHMNKLFRDRFLQRVHQLFLLTFVLILLLILAFFFYTKYLKNRMFQIEFFKNRRFDFKYFNYIIINRSFYFNLIKHLKYIIINYIMKKFVIFFLKNNFNFAHQNYAVIQIFQFLKIN